MRPSLDTPWKWEEKSAISQQGLKKYGWSTRERVKASLFFIYYPENLFIKPVGFHINATGHMNLLSQLTAVATAASPHQLLKISQIKRLLIISQFCAFWKNILPQFTPILCSAFLKFKDFFFRRNSVAFKLKVSSKTNLLARDWIKV